MILNIFVCSWAPAAPRSASSLPANLMIVKYGVRGEGEGWESVHARAEDACWNEADKRAHGKHFEGDGGEGCAEVDEPVGEQGRYADAGEVEQEVVFVKRDGRVQRLGGREVGGQVEE